jgi:hypothetical protein
MHPVESNKEEVSSNKEEVSSDKKIFQRKWLSAFKAQKNPREVNKVLEVETKTATDSIIIDGQETPLNIISITSQDKRDNI